MLATLGCTAKGTTPFFIRIKLRLKKRYGKSKQGAPMTNPNWDEAPEGAQRYNAASDVHVARRFNRPQKARAYHADRKESASEQQ